MRSVNGSLDGEARVSRLDDSAQRAASSLGAGGVMSDYNGERPHFYVERRPTSSLPAQTCRHHGSFRTSNDANRCLWLLKIPYALRPLRLHTFLDSLDSWCPSSSLCSTRFGS